MFSQSSFILETLDHYAEHARTAADDIFFSGSADAYCLSDSSTDERETDNEYFAEAKQRVKSAAKRARQRSSSVSASGSEHSQKKQKITNAGAARRRMRERVGK